MVRSFPHQFTSKGHATLPWRLVFEEPSDVTFFMEEVLVRDVTQAVSEVLMRVLPMETPKPLLAVCVKSH
jgi:hypothetical protein